MSINPNNLVWIDLEMTGLVVEKDRILEIALVITDEDLNILAESKVYAIHQTDELLNQMDEWNTEHHHASGLVARVRESAYTEAAVCEELLHFLRQYVPEGKSPMCGNSIWQDRKFLARYMPELEKYFHYRLLDVSTLKILALRWAPKVYNGIQKESKHLALSDIHDSIEELKYYRDHFLKLS